MTHFEEDVPFDCPYCMETNTIRVDLTAGKKQKFVCDCEICCHPILFTVEAGPEGLVSFSAEKE